MQYAKRLEDSSKQFDDKEIFLRKVILIHFAGQINPVLWQACMESFSQASQTDMGTSPVFRVIEQCCFNSVRDPFNGQTVNFILKPPKEIKNLC